MIARNIKSIQECIARAAVKSGRAGSDVIIVGVIKGVTTQKIFKAIDGGINCLGESKIQEAAERHSAIQRYAHKAGKCISLHMIGHLQSNKVNKALEFFTMIQSVDSFKLAQKLHQAAVKKNSTIDILIEVNTSQEDAKYGIAPKETKELLKQISELDRVRVRGLMTMAPLAEDKEQSRPCFRALRLLRNEIMQDSLLHALTNVKMEYLTMGMSQDFEVAIEEGANIVRIGSAIFQE